MALPLRMNPVEIKVRQFSKAATPVDPDFTEPRAGMTKTYAAEITLQGQIVYNRKDAREDTMTGDPGNTLGHLCFRKLDLDRFGGSGIMLQKGDIVTSIAGVAVNYKLTEVRPGGHLRGKANLILAFFEANEETNPAYRR